MPSPPTTIARPLTPRRVSSSAVTTAEVTISSGAAGIPSLPNLSTYAVDGRARVVRGEDHLRSQLPKPGDGLGGAGYRLDSPDRGRRRGRTRSLRMGGLSCALMPSLRAFQWDPIPLGRRDRRPRLPTVRRDLRTEEQDALYAQTSAQRRSPEGARSAGDYDEVANDIRKAWLEEGILVTEPEPALDCLPGRTSRSKARGDGSSESSGRSSLEPFGESSGRPSP